jgi:uncharacterized cupin superfamily protein
MIRCYRLFTSADGNSQVERGLIENDALTGTDHALFKETSPYSSLDWHNAPNNQYVITLSGILEFTVHSGETFIINPGDILLATDLTGTGHKWRLINDEPWKRVYVILKENEDSHFLINPA